MRIELFPRITVDKKQNYYGKYHAAQTALDITQANSTWFVDLKLNLLGMTLKTTRSNMKNE